MAQPHNSKVKENVLQAEKLRISFEKQSATINALPQAILRRELRGEL